MWTKFYDMHSGGKSKEPQEHIYIEASEEEAETYFSDYFGHHPNNITCPCCGNDYSISSDEDLYELTKYTRRNQTFEDYLKDPNVLVLYKKDLKDL